MRRNSVFFSLSLLFVSLCASPNQVAAQEANGGDAPKIYAALVRATNGDEFLEDIDETTPVLTDTITRKLKKSFDYQYFELMGEHTQPVQKEYESWLIPSEEMLVKVDYKGPAEVGLNLHLQIWRRENVLVKTDVVLKEDSPIFVGGPNWGNDQLVLVVRLD